MPVVWLALVVVGDVVLADVVLADVVVANVVLADVVLANVVLASVVLADVVVASSTETVVPPPVVAEPSVSSTLRTSCTSSWTEVEVVVATASTAVETSPSSGGAFVQDPASSPRIIASRTARRWVTRSRVHGARTRRHSPGSCTAVAKGDTAVPKR